MGIFAWHQKCFPDVRTTKIYTTHTHQFVKSWQGEQAHGTGDFQKQENLKDSSILS